MSDLRFDGKVVIITGSGGGLGKAYAELFGSRGAKVVVNDFSHENADKVVNSIKAKGGVAIANYDSVLDGPKIVQQVLKEFGRIDILINNAGILRDKSFKGMTDKDFNDVNEVHVKGAFAITHACWPVFRKQKYGRIINTASAAGLYGSFGQANYSAAKMGLVGFAKTLAREGVKYNIHANVIAPIAASAMTATILPPDVLAQMVPEHVAPIVAYLCHESCKESGQIFESGAGYTGLLRWEQSQGAFFKPDETFTPSAVALQWPKITDFTNALHPDSGDSIDRKANVEKAAAQPPNKQGPKIDFTDKVVVVTGAGAGIGRAHARLYGKLGAKVVVNDFSEKNANAVVEEIKKAGGQAAAVVASVEDGQKVVKGALDAFGGIHVIVNNAGILRDKSFTAMTEKEWDDVYNIHLKGSYSVTHAAWPIFVKQKYGRIINTASITGVHGNFGQANYATAKAALIGFTRTLAMEGKKYNITCNCLVPTAGTAMTATIWPKEMLEIFSPDYVSPPVVYLTWEGCKETGSLIESCAGHVSKFRWQRTYGHAFSNKSPATLEQVRDKWAVITRFDAKATNPTTVPESQSQILGNFGKDGEDASAPSNEDPEDSELVKKAKQAPIEDASYEWNFRDSILYNLGIGASEKELKYTFEHDDQFQVLPTFGVIPQFGLSSGIPLDWLPNFSPNMLLHGEQYLKIHKPIPTSGKATIKGKLLEVLDKGKAASVTNYIETVDATSGDIIVSSTSTVFIRGAGGFGGKRAGKDRGAATAVNKPPSRQPDYVSEFKTEDRQAAIYRLSGDYNPLHIQPEFAAVGGFDKPILHGLCSFGIAGKAIYDKYGPFSEIKVRFAGVLYPGETLVTETWKEGDKVIFVAKCKERKAPVLSSAAVTLTTK